MVDELTSGTQRHQARLRSNKPLTAPGAAEEIRELVLEVSDPDFHFGPGQSIAVVVPGPHELGHAEHVRFYNIADVHVLRDGNPEVAICVRRCEYLDEYSGERYEGVASKYLCELPEGAEVTLAGPVGLAFEVPEDRSANLLLIGLGTGIAPFRAFLRHIYRNLGGWEGQVRLFHGAKTGLELVYMNDHQNDIAEYLDEATFRAIEALSPRPQWDEPPALDEALKAHEEEVWRLLQAPNTWVYVAGIADVRKMLDRVLAEFAGSAESWARRKAELVAGGRWAEVVY
jgi:ferredoxin--NADP+ reductase